MATKKETTPEEITAEVQTAAETTETDPMEELMTVIIPLTEEHQEDVFIRVNQRTWLVKRGEEVQIPRCAALVYQNHEKAVMEMIQYKMKTAVKG